MFLENGITFEADLRRGQKTGFFLDQRENRARVEKLSQGKRVLNVFSYTGGFSVYAARGGAREVVSVDLSKPALDAAKRNFAHNSQNPAVASCQHETAAGDAFAVLRDLSRTGRVFDVVVIDPQNPLHVTKSALAYDSMVAGIVSSTEQAGYIAGSRSDGSSEKPVALAGRVLCKVSNENGPIQVGDLLTTSSVPGHAMKATDRDKAFGAILGKALQGFDGETGTIMVLVTLQ